MTPTQTEFNPAYQAGIDNWDNDEFDCPYLMDTPEMADFQNGRKFGEEIFEMEMSRLRSIQDEQNENRRAGGWY